MLSGAEKSVYDKDTGAPTPPAAIDGQPEKAPRG